MIKQIKSLVQFSRGTSLVWGSMSTPVPDGVVVFSIDDGAFRLGDGVTMFGSLPIMFTFSALVSAQGGVSGLFAEPVLADNGKIVVVSFDAGSNVTSYAVSNTTLASLLASLDAVEADNAAQDVAIASALSTALSIDVSINTGANGNLIVINDRRYSDSGTSISSVQATIAAQAQFTPGCHLDEPVFYTGVSKTKVADKLKLVDGGTYYVDLVGFTNISDTSVFELTTSNPNISIIPVAGSLFKVTFTGLTGGVKDDVPVILMSSIDDGTGIAKISKAISVLVMRQRILVSTYGKEAMDEFKAVVVDGEDNIICVGYSASEGTGGDAIVIKFDSSLNIIARKRYGGASGDYFYAVTTDNSNNIICAGNTYSEGAGNYDALVVKFDSALNIVARKIYGGTGIEYFYGVATDSSGNIICAGSTTSEGTSGDALVVKFDSSLNLIARKRYGGTLGDIFYGVAVDSANNIICAGYTASEGLGGNDGLVVKFDSSLNILARKRYGGTSNDQFQAVATDSSNNIICAGYTASEGLGGNEALVVKFDSSLNIVAKKRYGGTGNDLFYDVAVDGLNNIICSGSTNSEGADSTDGLVVKFDSSLNLIARKRYGGTSADQFYAVATDSSGNIICAGTTSSDGSVSGSAVGCVTKLSVTIPSGSFTGTILSKLTMADSGLVLADSTLTLANSALTLADSTLTLGTSALTLADSTLLQELDILN